MAAAAQPPTAPTTIALELSASPPEARLLLDGAPLPGNPYRGHVPSDHGLHLVRAVAPRLQAQERASRRKR